MIKQTIEILEKRQASLNLSDTDVADIMGIFVYEFIETKENIHKIDVAFIDEYANALNCEVFNYIVIKDTRNLFQKFSSFIQKNHFRKTYIWQR